jgi:hypothetical protein
MPRVKSRPKRWSEASEDGLTAISDVRDALEELSELVGEYSEWRDSLPENLEGSVLAEKLDEVIALDVESALSQVDDIENLLNLCDDAELPLGFGRD